MTKKINEQNTNKIRRMRLNSYYNARNEEFIKLKNAGLTYQQIADMYDPPYTRQAIHIAIKTHLQRKDKTKADSDKSA